MDDARFKSKSEAKILKLQSAVWLGGEHEPCKRKWVSEVRGRRRVTRSSFIPSTCIIDEMEEEKHRARLAEPWQIFWHLDCLIFHEKR